MKVTESRLKSEYYQALVERDPKFTGVFYVGVKTTGIFCIATCRARKPKFENVEFYTTCKEALEHGFRPCKICKPTENANEIPATVEKAIAWMRKNPKEKITDEMLSQKGINPVQVRRWFNQHYQMTFHAYQRMHRINVALEELRNGEKATTTAYDMGYESLSGFGYTFKKILGQSPKASTQQNSLLIERLTTPLGPMVVCATSKGLCLLEFTDREELEDELQELQERFGASLIMGENEPIRQAKQQLAEYFSGRRMSFEIPLDLCGTDFQLTVWQLLLQLPFGTTSSYGEMANLLNKPTAARAVGAANGRNKIAIVVPCHRVIGKNKALKGYAGGMHRKQWLLNHEQALMQKN